MRRRNHRKTVVAYLDGKILCEDCLQAALDNNMTLEEVKRLLVKENPNHEVTFKVK